MISKIFRRLTAADEKPAMLPTWQSPLLLDNVIRESDEGQALKILVNEIADLTKAMRELLMTCDRYVYFGGIIAAAALTLGVLRHDDKNNWMILVFAPYALALTFIYLVQIFTEVERRAGYLRFLEGRARAYARAPVLIFSEINARGARSRASNWGAQAINGVVLVALAGLSANESRRYDMRGPETFGLHLFNLHSLNLVLLALTLVTLGTAVLENSREAQRSYEAAAAAYERYAQEIAEAKVRTGEDPPR